jgi:uncharacterized membrane protein YvlD (DUF360 family)
MNRRKSGAIIFLCCVLAMPTCVKLLSGFQTEDAAAAVAMGVLLGAVHVVVRPILRIVSAPIGCLTLGLIQPVIDLGLIYACDYFVEGFRVTNALHALMAVFLINTVCFIAAGRR